MFFRSYRSSSLELGFLLLGLNLLMLPGSLSAQYTRPGTPAPQNVTPPREDLEESYEQARWRLGQLRIGPWLGFRDVAYVSNVSDRLDDEGDNDLTATVGAGLRVYLRSGKVYWTAHALPEYVYWQDAAEKRRLNGRYGLGMFAYWSRLTFEASARRNESQQFFTSELQQLTTLREDQLKLAAELQLARPLTLFATAGHHESQGLEDENPIFSLLDREVEDVELGIRFRPNDRWQFGVGWRDGSTDFQPGARSLSHEDRSGFATLGFKGARTDLQLRLDARSLEPSAGSEFQPLDEITGNLEVLWTARERITLLAYARRDVLAALTRTSTAILSERTGTRLELGGRRISLAWTAERGEDDFVTLPGASPRRDDVTVGGMEFSIELWRLIRLRLQALKTEYDSNLAPFDREVTTFGANLELGALFRRLRLGYQGGIW